MAGSRSEERHIATEAVERILLDLLRPCGYVQWEYLSRLRLLSRGILRYDPSRLLDVGCGYGIFARALAEGAGIGVVAIDVLPDRVYSAASKHRERIRPRDGNLSLLIADAAQGLPFRDASFDVVVATEVLEHLENPSLLLKEIRRVLRKGGQLFVTTPNAKALPYLAVRFLPRPLVRKLASALTQETLHPELLSRVPSHPDHHRREGFTLPELQGVASKFSLKVVRGYVYRIPLPDRVMALVPERLSRLVASRGARPIPLGLQTYCEFVAA